MLLDATLWGVVPDGVTWIGAAIIIGSGLYLLRREKVFAYRYEGKRYDCGSKEGFLQANVELALEHPLPEGRKNYTKTVPLQFEEFAPLIAWWAERAENDRAWKVPAAELLREG